MTGDSGAPGVPAGAGTGLTVARRVVVEVISLAALEAHGVSRVGRHGPRWRAWLSGSPVRVHVRNGGVEARISVVARPGQDLRVVTADVRAAVGAAIERLLGLEAVRITVIVDAVGA